MRVSSLSRMLNEFFPGTDPEWSYQVASDAHGDLLEAMRALQQD